MILTASGENTFLVSLKNTLLRCFGDRRRGLLPPASSPSLNQSMSDRAGDRFRSGLLPGAVRFVPRDDDDALAELTFELRLPSFPLLLPPRLLLVQLPLLPVLRLLLLSPVPLHPLLSLLALCWDDLDEEELLLVPLLLELSLQEAVLAAPAKRLGIGAVGRGRRRDLAGRCGLGGNLTLASSGADADFRVGEAAAPLLLAPAAASRRLRARVDAGMGYDGFVLNKTVHIRSSRHTHPLNSEGEGRDSATARRCCIHRERTWT